jgi:hypothetical protein
LSAANVAAENEFARNLLASLKSGVLLNGTVRSHSTDSTQMAWIAVEFPAIGERQFPVKTQQNLELGQEVVIECVSDPHKPGHYLFRLAGDAASPEME